MNIASDFESVRDLIPAECFEKKLTTRLRFEPWSFSLTSPIMTEILLLRRLVTIIGKVSIALFYEKNRLSVPAGNFRQRQMKKKKGLGEVTEEDEIRKWIGGRWTLKSAQKLLKKYGTLHEGEPI